MYLAEAIKIVIYPNIGHSPGYQITESLWEKLKFRYPWTWLWLAKMGHYSIRKTMWVNICVADLCYDLQCEVSCLHVFLATVLSSTGLRMPKNPNKQKINPGRVTHATWITKNTTRGPKMTLLRLDATKDPISTIPSQSIQFSPSKPGPSDSQFTFGANIYVLCHI